MDRKDRSTEDMQMVQMLVRIGFHQSIGWRCDNMYMQSLH